jgi:sRNA-binding protein
VSVKSKKQQLREQSAELMTAARALLKQYLPRQPYAVGVGAELEALRPEAILARAVRFALQERVRSEFYLTKLTDPGAHRYGIGGADCGPVSDEDRAHGLERLEALRKQKSKASRQGNGSHIREQSIPGSGLSAPKFPGEHSEA